MNLKKKHCTWQGKTTTKINDEAVTVICIIKKLWAMVVGLMPGGENLNY